MTTLAEEGRKLNRAARGRWGGAGRSGKGGAKKGTGKACAGRIAPPFAWLTTDPRCDGIAAARGLPAGGGVVLRHYDDPARAALARTLAVLCRARRLTLAVAADVGLAARAKAEGLHLPEGLARHGLLARALLWRRAKGTRFLSVAVHDRNALRRARALNADVVFLSPAFATASHPGARPLGALRVARLTRETAIPVVALGGVRAATARRLKGAGVWGLAAVSGWNMPEASIPQSIDPRSKDADPFP